MLQEIIPFLMHMSIGFVAFILDYSVYFKVMSIKKSYVLSGINIKTPQMPSSIRIFPF